MKQPSPHVTIAIPTYNRASSYLPQAIECALQQSYPNVELVVSDNCSSDDTEQVVKSFSDPRIKYFRHEKNIGANNNFNFCVKQANGSYFLLLHDDDLIDYDFIETCMMAANYDTKVGVLRTGMRLIDAQGQVIATQPNKVKGFSMEELIFGWFNGKTWPYLCNTLFNTQRLKEIGGFSSKHNLFQDVTAIMVLAARFGRIDVEAIKASSREHSGEITFSTKVHDWCEDSIELLDLLCGLVRHDKKHLVRREGMKFFARINYKRASAIPSSFKRIREYLVVLKKFRYQHSPIMFLIYSNTFFVKAQSFTRKTVRLMSKFFVALLIAL